MVYTAMVGTNMNINQLINELTQWYDFSVSMMRHHPVITVTAVLVAFVFHML